MVSVSPSPSLQRASERLSSEHGRAERLRVLQARRDQLRAHRRAPSGRNAAIRAGLSLRSALVARYPATTCANVLSSFGSGICARRFSSVNAENFANSLAASFAHGVGEFVVIVGEEQERLLRAVLLVHEQQRNLRRQQQQPGRGAQRVVGRPASAGARPTRDCRPGRGSAGT